MHGRKKFTKTPEMVKVEKEKIKKYNSLKNKVFELRDKGDVSASTLVAMDKLLWISPDFGTLWNYRRKILVDSGLIDDPKQLKTELMLTFSILKDRDIKSYSTYHHRIWIVKKKFSHKQKDLENELRITESVLSEDLRNFHVWNYRKKILNLLPKEFSEEKELKFLTSLFKKNPSNYSAWHNKSLYLKKVEDFRKEFELCQNLFYTDPEDSSSWMFHRYLICQLKELLDSKYCYELMELLDENEKKWPVLTILQNMEDSFELLKDVDEKKEFIKKNEKSIYEYLNLLVKVDPFRKGFYLDKRSDFLLRLGFLDISTKEVVMKSVKLSRFDFLKGYKNLKKIDLSDNEITRIPIDMKEMDNLEELVLKKNKITDVYGLKIFTKLKSLNLEDNLIKYIEKGTVYSDSLTFLAIKGNPIDLSGIDLKENFPQLEKKET